MLNNTSTSVSYVGNGTNGPFPIPFKFLDASHIVALKKSGGIVSTLVLNTDFTVAGAGSDDGGDLTTTVNLEVGESLTITRVMPVIQGVQIPDHGPFFGSTLEKALDYTTMVIQQVVQNVVDLQTRQPVDSGGGGASSSSALRLAATDGNTYQLDITDNGDGTFSDSWIRVQPGESASSVIATDGNLYQLNVVDNGDGTFSSSWTRIA